MSKEEVKKVKKSRDLHKTMETVKTVVIAVLITGIVSFMAGAKYQDKVNAQVKTVEKTVVAPEVKAEVPVVSDLK